MVELEHVALAHYRLAPYLAPTPLERAPGFERVWLKAENANQTHSFKVRGALNALLTLSPDERARGVVTASSGNHAQGIAYAAHLIGLRARVLMPHSTPQRKVNATQRHGAEVLLFGEGYSETEREARRIERDEGLVYVSPYNDARVIAGAGTVGLEIIAALPDVDRVIVPVGGGGLISGIATAVKRLRPSIEIIGVNAAVSPDMYNVFYEKSEPLTYDTLADALPGAIEADSITLDMTQRLVDRIVCVTEAEIAAAMRWLLGETGWLVEGGGAVGMAAILSGTLAPIEGNSVVVLSGGNVDLETIQRVIE